MPLKNSLLSKLQTDFPQLQFLPGEGFRWSSSTNTIYYPAKSNFTEPELLHELGHALLDHYTYQQDIDLIRIEREAWEHATAVLGPLYKINIPSSMVDESVDTYREWLHARSLCLTCRQTGIQTKTGIYQCLNCRCQWRANEARICMLRRYKI